MKNLSSICSFNSYHVGECVPFPRPNPVHSPHLSALRQSIICHICTIEVLDAIISLIWVSSIMSSNCPTWKFQMRICHLSIVSSKKAKKQKSKKIYKKKKKKPFRILVISNMDALRWRTASACICSIEQRRRRFSCP